MLVTLAIILNINNSLALFVDDYSTFSWILDYRFGFCKRGFLGTCFKIVCALFDWPLNVYTLRKVMCVSHILMVIISFVGTSFLFFYSIKKTKYQFLLFLIFLFLATSFFFKNLFFLTGYTDIWIYNLYLFSLFFIAKRLFYISIIFSCIGCLFSELSCVFWFPITVAYFLNNRLDRNNFAMFLPFVCGIGVHFSGIPYNYFKVFYDEFGLDILSSTTYLFEKQYDLVRFLERRLPFLIKCNFVIFCSIAFIGAINFVYFFLGLRFSKFWLYPFWKGLFVFALVSLSTLGTLFLFILATDLWRIVGFSIFSAFLFCFVFLLENKGCNISDTFSGYNIFFSTLGCLISAVTLFLPAVTTYGGITLPKTHTTFMYNEGDDYFLLHPLLLDTYSYYEILGKSAYSSYRFHDNNYITNVNCSMYGGRYVHMVQSYGKLTITIDADFDDMDPDQSKVIRIWDTQFIVKRGLTNVYEYDLSAAATVMYHPITVWVLPSSHDWKLRSIKIEKNYENGK